MSFKKKTYLGQVRQLRKVAEEALKQYPIRAKSLVFINHGENATFKVNAGKKNYLLRIHRNQYHSKPAIMEELKWLKDLAIKSDIPVQKPVLTHRRTLIVNAGKDSIGEDRFCDLLEWRDGKITYKALGHRNLYNLGVLMAKLHKSSSKKKVVHRNYWHAEGLLGKKSIFGPLSNMKEILGSKYSVLEKCRSNTLRKIKNYEKRNPDKISMIHADLHFGNIIWSQGELSPIDFDDCGRGSYTYDFAVTLCACTELFNKDPKKKEVFTKALFEGYNSIGELAPEDIKIIPHYMVARRIALLGWLYDRRDNPKLFKHLKKNIQKRIDYLNKVNKDGADPLY